MAAALLRGAARICVRCLHRELCRVVWRPQSALFSSKPSDRKPPRRTHIKKSKPHPPIDVAKLLEKLFSQRRPGTAPPAGTARPAKASSTSTKPSTTSVDGSASNVPPSSKPGTSIFPSSSSFKQSVPNKTVFNTAQLFPQPKSSVNPKTSFSSESHPQPNRTVIQASAADSLYRATVHAMPASSTASSGSEEPAVESQALAKAVQAVVTIETPVESSLPPVEPPNTRTSVVEDPAEPSIDAAVHNVAQELQTSTKDSGTAKSRVEPLIETTTGSPAESSLPPVEALENRASVEVLVEPTVDVSAEVPAEGAPPRMSMEASFREATIESPVESSLPLVEQLETRSPVVEGSVDPTADSAVDPAAQEVKSAGSGLVDVSHGAKQQLLKETTTDSPVDATVSQKASKPEALTLESVTLSEVEAEVGRLESEALQETCNTLEKEADDLRKVEKMEVKTTAEDVGISETQTELSTVDSISEATEAIEAETAMLMEAMVGSGPGPKQPTEAPLQELGPHDETTGQEADKESLNVLEAMSLESVTLAEVEASLGTLGSESLSETTSYLEKEAELLAGEEKMEVKTTAEDVASFEDETEAKLLTVDSISEATDAIEAETAVLMEAMFGSEQGPKQLTDAPLQELRPQDEMMVHESDKESLNVLEAMSLESVTLAEVEASLGALESQSLSETTSYLEKEAEVLAGEEKMEVKTTAEDVAILETQTELSTVDSISEAADAIEAETAMLMEAMFGSEQGPKQLTEAPLQELGPQSETLSQEVDKESLNVLEAMSLESVTLAEVEASLGTLANESLSETTSYLEKEAEVLAGEEKMEVKTTAEDVAVSEDETEAEVLTVDSISEATDAIEAETAVLMEAMFGSEQGPKQPTEAPLQELGPRDETTGQEAETETVQEGGSVLEAMSLESVTLAEVEASLGTLGNESLSETTSYLEKEAELLAGEEKMKVDEGTASKEATEALKFEPLPEADTEDLQTDALIEELLFTVPQDATGETGQQTGPEVVTANVLDAAAADTVTAETVEPPSPPVSKEVVLEEVEEVKEDEATRNEEDMLMHTDLDPVQRLFLDKIREYKNLRRLNGGLLEAEPDYIKHLSEETAKLQRLYGGGDLTSFPQFTFAEPELDQDSK